MNKNNGLSKKALKKYSSQISKKLTDMGIEDKIDFVASGAKVKVFKKDGKGGVLRDDNTGIPIEFEVDTPIARNIFRRTLKRLLNNPEEVICAFLRSPIPKKEVKADEPPTA